MKKDIRKIIEILNGQNLPRTDFVQLMEGLKNPYLVLIFCILSLRTKDETTYPAALRLFELAKTPKDMMEKSEEDIAKAIYPVGFYKNKASQIKELSKKLIEEYNGQVPCDIEELCKFKGVGRKTANLTMAKGFGKPAICVDVHVHRICNRIGYVQTKEPDETELVLRKQLPKDLWLDINTILVTFGQNICRPINPKCDICKIKKYCNSAQ
ncbi:MAG: endonuclease III [bacterium]|nr:endonuclease III [bacterium]